ncbi:PDZ domain-containing protein [Bremerella cremea]|uniref:PDZ domain-containing protein n=1 Tax=Bremerella cremea TaxID=1031537 RepID=A0A368KXC3_9BACT|nr:trypsin-like peptidase domain-containing protein [Bremerella cremea]RCS55952.1 PDZ domain-containing protein [Bremerella cremea]
MCGKRTFNLLLLVLTLAGLGLGTRSLQAEATLRDITRDVQRKVVKIYGAGGLRGLESYQSGSLITPNGHILTAWSYVLDSSVITVVLDDGRHFTAELAGADPRFGIALLKIDAEELPFFNLDEGVSVQPGERILSFSNLFGIAAGDEPASVLSGYVSAIAPLEARRSAFPSAYQGPVLIVDAIVNNPGAAGGILTDQSGHFVGLIGKELRSSRNDIWLNYALPVAEIKEPIEDLLAGRSRPFVDPQQEKPQMPLTLAHLGLVLVPDVLDKTPVYVERVERDSLAAAGNLQPDDLIMYVDGTLISSQDALVEKLSYIDRDKVVSLIVLRDKELIEITLNELK